MDDAEAVEIFVVVEGESDAAAVRALADRVELDLNRRHVAIRPANGVTNYARVLADLARTCPHAGFCGLYDVAERRFVRKALSTIAVPVTDETPLETFGFFACIADLEDELIRALGAGQVERAIEAEGELSSFRRFQAMPQHRGTPVPQQLRRFLGTRATRKIRAARRLVEALAVDQMPPPLAALVATLRSGTCVARAPAVAR